MMKAKQDASAIQLIDEKYSMNNKNGKKHKLRTANSKGMR